MIAYASTQRSDTGKLVTGADILPYERPYGALFPISGYAMVMQRHMHEFGTTREQLAKVAVAASQWAALNPEALKPEPLTIDDVLASPLVSDPLRKLDICLVTQRRRRDRADHARAGAKLNPKPVDHGARAPARATAIATCRTMRNFTTTAGVESGKAAYEMAGLGPARHRRRADLRRVHDHGAARSRGPRLLREGRGRAA